MKKGEKKSLEPSSPRTMSESQKKIIDGAEKERYWF